MAAYELLQRVMGDRRAGCNPRCAWAWLLTHGVNGGGLEMDEVCACVCSVYSNSARFNWAQSSFA